MLALAAAQQALDGAGLARSLKNEKKNTFTVDGIDPARCAVYCGSGIGGLTSLIYNQANHVVSPVLSILERLRPGLGDEARFARATLDAARQDIRMPQRFNPFIVSMTMPNAVSANIGIKYSLFGPNMTACCACAAGTVAIGQGFSRCKAAAQTLRCAAAWNFSATNSAAYSGDSTLPTRWSPQEAIRRPPTGRLTNAGRGFCLPRAAPPCWWWRNSIMRAGAERK